MNGFYVGEHSGLDPFGHYNGTTVPLDWDLAEEYTLSDNFYSSVLDYSLPNHWHIVAGQAPAQENVTQEGGINKTKFNVSTVIQYDHQYLNESNATESIEDALARDPRVTWDYYDFPLSNYSNASSIQLNANGTQIEHIGLAYAYFNPQAAKYESYTSEFDSHFVNNTRFYSDARAGRLPELSWLIPPGQFSDHPPDNSTDSQAWLASVVDALEASPDWNSSVMYITWDDYGGFYDNMDPPAVYGQQLGFRVPLLIISPYSTAGSVSHQFGYFESVLRLMEWRFGLGCITKLDCEAPLPLWGFNFSGPPRAPILFPTNFSLASYPYDSNWNASALGPPAPYFPPEEFTYFPDGEAPDID